jgi:putative nucleotidyltransferase with HDIG domain
MHDLISATLCDQMLAVFEDPGYRPPPLPDVALELMAMATRPHTDVGEVVRLLERDAMLAATVLRLVGSPIYAGRTPIRTLSAAVMRLGLQGVRDAVFHVSLSRGAFSSRDYADTMATVARHCTVTAYLTRVVCRRSGIDVDTAFMCGLLHDIGFAGLMLAVSQVEGEGAPPLVLLWKDIDRLHEQASNLLCERWGLPSHITEVVGHHHHLHTGALARQAAAVRLADHLTERFGATVLGPLVEGSPMRGDATEPFDVETACVELGIEDTQLAAIVADAERIVPDIVWA